MVCIVACIEKLDLVSTGTLLLVMDFLEARERAKRTFREARAEVVYCVHGNGCDTSQPRKRPILTTLRGKESSGRWRILTGP